jgi:hypothetical protein
MPMFLIGFFGGEAKGTSSLPMSPATHAWHNDTTDAGPFTTRDAKIASSPNQHECQQARVW